MQRSSGAAVVIGGSRGIGAAVARRLAADGYVVLVTYVRRADAAAEVVASIERAGGSAHALAVDVTAPEQVTEAFVAVAAQFGPPAVVVHCAAIGETRPLVAIDEGHLQRLLATNLVGAVRVGVEAGRRLRDGGRLVLLSSLNGRIASPGASLYAATKAAVESLTRSWALELGARGITVNAVAPGFTETDMLAAALPAEHRPAAIAMTALGRIGAPEDIADVVAFLASDAGRWVTGQVIAADGGVRPH